jgi:hypothetical protein
MIQKPAYFQLEELVCEEVFNKYGDTAWQFFDPRLLQTIDIIRGKLNRSVIINNWNINGQFSQRGLRCPLCALSQQTFQDKVLFMDPHAFGQAFDFDAAGMLAEETRQWIITNQYILPYPIRLEAGVDWCHLDIRDAGNGKVFIFNS